MALRGLSPSGRVLVFSWHTGAMQGPLLPEDPVNAFLQLRNRIDARLGERAIVAIVYVAALFVSILDSTIINVALPTLSTQFHVPTASIEWVVTGYLLSLAVWIPASGWIGDRFGTKRVMLYALAIFTAASLACGLATSLPELIAFRIAQGVGGGMLTPVGLAMLYRAFPPERRAAASKVLIIPTAIAPASGPIVGGLLIDQLSWRWVFFVNVPLGIAAFAFGALFLKEQKEPTAGRFDLPGFALSATALAALLYAMSEGPASGWGSAQVLVSAALAIIAGVALVRVENWVEHPMLKLALLRDRLFRATNTASIFASAAFLATLFIMPTFLQVVQGVSPLQSGLTTFPEALGVLSFSQLAGRLYPRVGPRRLMMAGMALMAALLFLVSRINIDTNLWTIRLLMFSLGGSFAFMLISLQAASFATISSADTGRASALFSTQRQMASAIGVAIIATCLAAFLPGDRGEGIAPVAQVPAFRGAFLVAAGIAALGVFAAATVRDSDAASTMVIGARTEAVAAH
jgi:EmrB/QacA subfamily drug resistance transporter